MSRQRFLKNAAFLAEQGSVVSARQPVSAGNPGSTLTSGPHRIAVEAAVSVHGFSAPALEIVVTGNAQASPLTSPVSGSASPTSSDSSLSAEAPAAPSDAAAPSHATGFTHEEELFRTRWGWAAFNDVQRAAFGTAHETE